MQSLQRDPQEAKDLLQTIRVQKEAEEGGALADFKVTFEEFI